MDGTLFLLSGVAILAVGVIAGVVLMRLRMAPEVADLSSRLREAARQQEDLRPAMERLQADNESLSSFLVMLPDVARRLNSHLEKRNIGPLLASVLDHVLDPSRILIFFTNREEKNLYLAFKKGVSETVPMGLRLSFNDGMIGWVAKHHVTMDREDFHDHTAGARRGGLNDRPLEESVSIDLIAPMTYENECLGVICVGGTTRKTADHKRMVKMVADLGSLALYNYMLYTWFQGMANSDALTKMFTKRYLLIRLGEEIHKAEQRDEPLSILIFDIDHFKKYNDAHGHLVGDELLRRLSKLVLDEIREDDTAARYGGEEFVVVLPSTRKENAVAIAEKIRKLIEATAFPHAESQPLGRLTISGGVATLGPDGRSTNELLRAADQALYLAKEQGRNRIVAYKFRYLSDEDESPDFQPRISVRDPS
jgi:diguanylate cyclase (GGDEF)-like protein